MLRLLVLVFAVAASCECQGRSSGPPGAEPYDRDLSRRIADAIARLGPSYRPRTRHFNPDGTAKFTNRLILETSPYLVQHAHNPVDWYPWGEAAFDKARRQDKPIFLSIGYSTCHWCHVMEDESFEDEDIARVLNRYFVPIKVDREERPDLDAIYLTAVQQITGSAGWPLTVFLLPDKRPFFGGTYFPPRDGAGGVRIGLLTLLDKLRVAFHDDRSKLAALAAQLVAAHPAQLAGDMPGAAVIRNQVAQLSSSFDPAWGGFGAAPWFPRPAALELLLHYHRRTGDVGALDIVTRTLERMAAGGIYDQLGGGFHRYAVDAKWRVPHFEKMLYDNAQLASIYLDAYQATARDDFAQVARETLDYIAREMRSPDGGFYSATDADIGHVEGTYFTWTASEIDRVLGDEQGRIARAYFDVTAGGNFDGGRSVLWRPRPIADVAASLGIELAAAQTAIADARKRLFAARSRRIGPLTDRKVLVAWNGLMISAMARASLVLDDTRYRDLARGAASDLLARARGPRGLGHEAAGSGDAFLDDYACLEAGLLDLFEADPDPRWLREAIALQDALDANFADPRGGGYFFTSERHEQLIARDKPDRDDALPAGNSIAAANLLRLHAITSDDRYRQRAEASFRAFAAALARAPATLPKLLVALDFYLDRAKQIVIVSPEGSEPSELLARLRNAFVPNRVLVRVVEGESQRAIAAVSPLVEAKRARDGKPTAYVCVGNHCEQPTSDPTVFARQLASVEPL